MTAIANDTDATDAAQPDVNALLKDVPDPTADALRAFWDHMRAENEALQETVERQAERIDDLEAELDNQATNVAGAFTKLGAIDDRITENAERLETVENEVSEPAPETDNSRSDKPETGSQTDETPMERIIQYSEDAATEHLTANEQRARFIAKDVADYARKVPAGLVVDSSTIRKVVKAKEGDRPHTQTVARIMKFLDDFGKDTVTTVKRRGKRLIVFDEDAARRYQYHSRCDRGSGPDPSEAVMTPG